MIHECALKLQQQTVKACLSRELDIREDPMLVRPANANVRSAYCTADKPSHKVQETFAYAGTM